MTSWITFYDRRRTKTASPSIRIFRISEYLASVGSLRKMWNKLLFKKAEVIENLRSRRVVVEVSHFRVSERCLTRLHFPCLFCVFLCCIADSRKLRWRRSVLHVSAFFFFVRVFWFFVDELMVLVFLCFFCIGLLGSFNKFQLHVTTSAGRREFDCRGS